MSDNPNQSLALRWARGADQVPLAAAVVGGGLAALTWASGWHGADFPAAIHRIDLFRAAGFTPWDGQWFGGHYTLGYSVLLAPLAVLLGIGGLVGACAAVSAWAFARLLRAHFGRHSWLGAVWFAIGLVAPVAIGQLAFILGATLALLAVLAFAARRRVVAGVLGALCPLASPVAAALLLLALAAWAVTSRGPSRRAVVGLGLLTAAPIAVLELLFPQSGRMPFAATTLSGVLVVSALGLWLLPARERTLRLGAGLYGLAGLALFVVPQPMGANLGRLGTAIGGPIAATVLWPRRRLLLALVAVPLLLWQWIPAIGSVVKDGPDPSKDEVFFSPLVSYLRTQGAQLTRVEIPPTQDHWESLWAAADLQLARGWERQLDIADNGIFYDPATLTSDSYQAWLLGHGVSWVALPVLRLDYSGQLETALVRTGLPYLTPAWHDANWQVWRVVGSPGLVQGPAKLVAIGPNSFDLQVARPATLTVRVRYTRFWTATAGHACITPSADGWTVLAVTRPGRVQITSRLIGGGNGCGSGEAAPARSP
ncbi:MAG: hypothetical protein M3083_07565 [Actinomycetota bacterium]|nr:hypothetical protein [Actinomycetota bacterium]